MSVHFVLSLGMIKSLDILNFLVEIGFCKRLFLSKDEIFAHKYTMLGIVFYAHVTNINNYEHLHEYSFSERLKPKKVIIENTNKRWRVDLHRWEEKKRFYYKYTLFDRKTTYSLIIK